MALDMIEATSGMGMHMKNIPPNILERQMKARSIYLHNPNLYLTLCRPSGSPSPSTTPPSSAQKHPSCCNTSASSPRTVCALSAGS